MKQVKKIAITLVGGGVIINWPFIYYITWPCDYCYSFSTYFTK